jgi:hypothetical protein
MWKGRVMYPTLSIHPTAAAQDATPSIFWNIVTASGATSAALFASVYVYWRLKPFSAHKKRVSDMKALRDLVLYNADDLEDVLAALSERATCAIPSDLTLHPLGSPARAALGATTPDGAPGGTRVQAGRAADGSAGGLRR